VGVEEKSLPLDLQGYVSREFRLKTFIAPNSVPLESPNCRIAKLRNQVTELRMAKKEHEAKARQGGRKNRYATESTSDWLA
jgi:hypothetical protein